MKYIHKLNIPTHIEKSAHQHAFKYVRDITHTMHFLHGDQYFELHAGGAAHHTMSSVSVISAHIESGTLVFHFRESFSSPLNTTRREKRPHREIQLPCHCVSCYKMTTTFQTNTSSVKRAGPLR